MVEPVCRHCVFGSKNNSSGELCDDPECGNNYKHFTPISKVPDGKCCKHDWQPLYPDDEDNMIQKCTKCGKNWMINKPEPKKCCGDKPDPKAWTKPSNPKDAVGIRKWRQFCTVPLTVIWHIGVAMLEGACKYGRHNYRETGVGASVYIDAAKGHIDQWWEGEDLDPDSGLCHLDKAMASLVVLRDGMLHGNYNDDRPPKANIGAIRKQLQGKVEEILDKYPNPLPPYTEVTHGKSAAYRDVSS